MSTLSEIGEAAQAVKELAKTLSHLCVLMSDTLREMTALAKQGRETTAALQQEAKRVLDNAQSLSVKLEIAAASLPAMEAAVNRTIEKASRKLDGVPDHLFPLTIQAPGT